MKIGVIGAGQLGLRLINLLVASHDVAYFECDPVRSASAASLTSATPSSDLKELVAHADIVIVAVKPQAMLNLSEALRPYLRAHHLLVSVAAGYSTAQLRDLFLPAQSARLVPNLALTSGEAVMALEKDPSLSPESCANLEQLLAPGGQLFWVPSHKMEMIIALAGSGMGFVALMIEAMAEGGIAMGLNSEEALALSIQTFLGTATLLRSEKLHPAELRWQVASPAGTTIEGLRTLEAGAVRSSIIESLINSFERGKELGQ